MGLVLTKIEDPRDALQKARRSELVAFARRNNVSEIEPGMPAILMRRILRNKGLTHIEIPHRVLGRPEAANMAAAAEDVETVNAEEDLARQYGAYTKPPDTTASLTLPQLRAEVKRRGLKQERGESAASLRAKLNGQDPS